MSAQKTIEVRVNDYIGTSGELGGGGLLTRIPSIEDIAEKAIFDMMKSLPPEVTIPLLEATAIAAAETTISDSDVHIYSAFDAAGRPMLYLDPEAFGRAGVTGGNAEVTELDPVYTLSSTGTDTKLKVLPTTTTGHFYALYPVTVTVTTAILGGTGGLTHVPMAVHEAIILDICIKGLKAKMSDLVQDEEDPEMVTTMTEQIKHLQGAYQFELSKILGGPQEEN